MPRFAVEGVVTLDGQNIDAARIVFAPLKEGASSAGEISNGKFRLPRSEGLTPGQYRVEIYRIKPTGRKIPDPEDPKVLNDQMANTIPPRYNSETELKVEIPDTGPKEPLSFSLTSKTAVQT